jgi:hypothetical protein
MQQQQQHEHTLPVFQEIVKGMEEKGDMFNYLAGCCCCL